MTVAIIHLTKGGSGKTTLGTNLAVEFALRGLKPTLVDFDTDQGASSHFIAKRYGWDILDIDLLEDPSTNELENNIRTHRNMIFDTGGYDSSTTQALIATADVVLIPVLNNDIETNSLIKLSEKIHKIGKITGRNINLIIVPSRIHYTCSKDKVEDYFKELKSFGYKVSNPIYYRLSYQRAYALGKGVTELNDKKAKGEIIDLCDLLLGDPK